MFRNPRDRDMLASVEALLPSVGRPPTPPSQAQSSSPYFSMSGKGAAPSNNAARTTQPAVRQPSARKPSAPSGKNKRKENTSILSFFSKTSSPAKSDATAPSTGKIDDGLFFPDETPTKADAHSRQRSVTPGSLYEGVPDGDVDETDSLMMDSSQHSVKRRKIESSDQSITESVEIDGAQPGRVPHSPSRKSSLAKEDRSLAENSASTEKRASRKPVRRLGGFIDDSESEDEAGVPDFGTTLSEAGASSGEARQTKTDRSPDHTSRASPSTNLRREESENAQKPLESEQPPAKVLFTDGASEEQPTESQRAHNFSFNRVKEEPGLDEVEGTIVHDAGVNTQFHKPEVPPTLKHEETSVYGMDDFDGFDGIEDFEDEEFAEEGEEYLERRYMEEQRMLEQLANEDGDNDIVPTLSREVPDRQNQLPTLQAEESVDGCPMCGGCLAGATEAEATTHVNNCLDGRPTPLPQKPQIVKVEQPSSTESLSLVSGHKRFQRAAIARPGQENPFAMSSNGGGSAFSKLMSGHAEDAAWATAAANENASRGKPAYQRTCPFYKIMPGFFICVDAFRYGAVQGCNAYFLSHFHSDHYVGLTSSWSHGPIYCSRVTANLVRQQLKVDPKWVVDLEFEKKVEVPRTQGVFVTMIPANHCPGSSLYLFEKAISGRDRKPKSQRVLHCGDFRACPAHVQHPLLRPDVIDAVTKKGQMIDVCYLDTTYLNPKYAFPSQEDVIGSCSQMCVSLSKELVDGTDAYEQALRERAGTGMVKFLEKGAEEKKLSTDDSPPALASKPSNEKSRGRLLVVIGTYSIGKERICLGIARALDCKIYAPAQKQRICAALEDPELSARLTTKPLEAQIHMQTLMEIRADTLADYLTGFKPHFNRIVGFRPTGWSYRPPGGRSVENPLVDKVLHSDGWKSRFTMGDLLPQRGSGKESMCFGVPYSEHSSFRELTMFCCALRIGRVVPTVNVGSAKGRARMKSWIEKWELERKKNGLFEVKDEATSWPCLLEVKQAADILSPSFLDDPDFVAHDPAIELDDFSGGRQKNKQSPAHLSLGAREARREEKRERKLRQLREADEMKFSHSIQFNAVPDWANHYISYSNLKKLIYTLEKQINSTGPSQDAEQSPLLSGQQLDPDTTFKRMLDSELEKVCSFYQLKELEIYGEVSHLLKDEESYEHEAEGFDMDAVADGASRTRHLSLAGRVRQGSIFNKFGFSSRPRRTSTISASIEEHTEPDDSDNSDADERQALTRRSPKKERSKSAWDANKMTLQTSREDMQSSIGDLRTSSTLRRRPSVALEMDGADPGHISALYDSGITLKKRIISLYVSLCELKSFIQLNKTGFSKALKKYDKTCDRDLRRSFLDQNVNSAYPFREATMSHVDENIAKMEKAYSEVVTKGDLELARRELRLHLREHVVWERNTVWREMIGIERKAQAANMGLGRALLGGEHDQMKAGDDQDDSEMKEVNTPVGRYRCPRWLFSSTFLALVAIVAIFAVLLVVPIMKRPEQQNCLAMLVFVSLLWATEVIPLFVTSLLVPMLVVVLRIMRTDDKPYHRLESKDATKAVFAAMWTPVIMLLLGGFTIAAALSKYNIAKMMATLVLSKAGTKPRTVLITCMLLGMFLSMWISNVAAPVLCFSIIQPVLRNLPADSHFSKALILGIALASNIGGAASPIASPQNIIALQNMHPNPSWGVWFFIALPVCIISILLIWLLLLVTFKPGRGTTIIAIRPMKDRLNFTQYFIIFTTMVTIILWCVSHELEHVFGDMGVIAIIPMALFFGTGILTKEDFNNFLWTIIILAAGGLSLGKAVASSGLLHTIAQAITERVEGFSVYGVLVVFALLILVVATFISHTVAALIILPLVQSVGQGMPEPHPNLLVMGSALMCSAAMGLPTSGFPNMTAIMMEVPETGQRYLSVKHFLTRGVPASIMTFAVVVTVGYGLMSIVGL